jgi:hypothetical protein
MRYLILAQSEVTARALGAWLELLGERKVKDPGGDDRCFVADAAEANHPSDGFDRIANWIERILDKSHEGTTILVDSVRMAQLNPLGQSGWDPLVSMLILAFPEVRWILGVWDAPEPLKRFHGLPALLGPALNPLMDGTGLRERVRKIAKKADFNGKKPAGFLPKRKQWAVAIDDEKAYAFFNAFVAYRNGFRAIAINRRAQAAALFGEKATCPTDLALAFEDIFLNFPDRENKDEFSDLDNRNSNTRLNKLENADQRIFVTSSHLQLANDGRRRRNRDFIEFRRRPSGEYGRGAREVRKPVSGMFDLWEKSKLTTSLRWTDPETKRLVRGKGKNFLWPPSKKVLGNDEGTGHGAPGRLLQIAETMIRRAEEILVNDVTSVEEAVQGAVLATDALELLGDRTPTTAIEALALKHKFEVLAECQFSGTEYHIAIRERLEEIRRECEILARWFHPGQARVAAWNAEMHIVNQLVRILSEYNQFDEEVTCMNRVRHLHNHLWVRRKPAIFRPILLGISSYATWLMSSFLNFVLSFLACIVVLAGLHWWVDAASPGWDGYPEKSGVLYKGVNALNSIFSYFTGAEPHKYESWGLTMIVGLAALLGLIHLGIFLSFLYSIIARKS